MTVARPPLPTPLPPITSGYRPPGRPDHRGTDFGTPVGTPVYATQDGVVSIGDEPGGAGWWINLTGASGEVHKFFHLSERIVTSGPVKAGTLIARTGGAVGHPGAGSSTGPHLHYEVWIGGHDVDPWPYVQASIERAVDVILDTREWDEMATKAEIKAAVTEVFNELAGPWEKDTRVVVIEGLMHRLTNDDGNAPVVKTPNGDDVTLTAIVERLARIEQRLGS